MAQIKMQGYWWAKTPENELLIVMIVEGRGYVPAVPDAINLDEIFFLEPVRWPDQVSQPSPNLPPSKSGRPAPDATHECVIIPFAASA